MKTLKMKSINRFIFTSILISGLSISSFAQENERKTKSPEEKSEWLTQKMVKQLELSADQESKVKEINLSFTKEMEMLRKEQEALREKRKSTLAEHEANLKEALTKEQYEKYLEIKEENKEERQERRKERK